MSRVERVDVSGIKGLDFLALQFFRELPQVALGVGAAAKFVEAFPTERAVCRVPPDEIGHGGRPGQDKAQREEEDG